MNVVTGPADERYVTHTEAELALPPRRVEEEEAEAAFRREAEEAEAYRLGRVVEKVSKKGLTS